MSAGITIALDAMGGDFGPDIIVPAAISALDQHPELNIILVGDEDILRQSLNSSRASGDDRIRVHHASQQVEMDELPQHALRNKKDSSMRVAINLVQDGVADACVSAGNTGALMATARFVLKMLPGIDRPAICTALPNLESHTWMLDLGANVDSDAEHLLQFAMMGSVLSEAVDGNSNPRIGLLNIGAEDIKGNEQVKEAAQLLGSGNLNYKGYAEGDDIYKGGFDVIVCDGFVGNVSLKTSEGVAKMIGQFIRQEFSRNFLTRLAAVVARPVLKAFRHRIDPRRYNGASLLGLKGIVIKSHGSADALSFSNAIKVALVEVRESVPERISNCLQHHLDQELTQ
ncbi:MAG: phosphate acyltransferase PlsX [Gammaproteobacteria bacterium]|nr:MAG: phosphate acyltransferase PlsX [Gammaproteobacteria bacterium]